MSEITITVPVTGVVTSVRERRNNTVTTAGSNQPVGLEELMKMVDLPLPHGMTIDAVVVDEDPSSGTCQLRLTVDDANEWWLSAVSDLINTLDDDPEKMRLEVAKMVEFDNITVTAPAFDQLEEILVRQLTRSTPS